MSQEQMPATDAAHYELAFHVLPTVAEGEVADVTDSLKAAITAAGGAITEEEAPERFELAYDIVKYLEGRNRKFSSAYFGWIRFTLTPDKLAEVQEVVEGTNQLLRHLIVRLTKQEEEHVFFFHEALDTGTSETIEIDEETAVVEAETDNEVASTDADTDESEEKTTTADSAEPETEVK